MRDLLITLIVVGSLPYILARPYIGILVWSWIGYMNPHRLGWGFAYNFPFAQIVAVALFVGILFSKEPKRIPINHVTVIWIMFLLWMCVTTAFAMYPDNAQEQLSKVLKIQLISFLTMMLMNNRERLHSLVWVIVISLGFFGVKGGVFTILTGGSFRVLGPTGSYIEGNNEVALAILIVAPLVYYLRETAKNVWMKRALLACMLLMVISAIGSQSRGAMLAALAMGGYFWIKSRHKIVVGVAAIIVGIAIFAFMPKGWHDRMSTIETYNEDESAMGRINSWHMATNLAAHRFTGGGYEIWTPENFARYAPNPNDLHDAHSIYFEVLGEQGFVGLFLFLLLWFFAFRSGGALIKKTNDIDELGWLNVLARMVQVSIIVYLVGGSFLGLAYFDLPYHLIAILMVGHVITQKHYKDHGLKKL